MGGVNNEVTHQSDVNRHTTTRDIDRGREDIAL